MPEYTVRDIADILFQRPGRPTDPGHGVRHLAQAQQEMLGLGFDPVQIAQHFNIAAAHAQEALMLKAAREDKSNLAMAFESATLNAMAHLGLGVAHSDAAAFIEQYEDEIYESFIIEIENQAQCMPQMLIPMNASA